MAVGEFETGDPRQRQHRDGLAVDDLGDRAATSSATNMCPAESKARLVAAAKPLATAVAVPKDVVDDSLNTLPTAPLPPGRLVA